MSRCRGCQAEIAFVKLRSGKLMPVESDEMEEYRVWLDPPAARVPTIMPALDETVTIEHRQLRLVTETGEVVRTWTAFLLEQRHGREIRTRLDGPCRITGYESHFATCPQADAFRQS